MLRKSAMYNLKVSTAFAPGGGPGGGPGPGLLSVDPQGVTPRTPEILNSLMAMSHPLDPFANSSTPNPAAAAAVPELGSPAGASRSSLAGSAGRSPPSLQHTRSQLIKEGLKLTLQTKRRHTSATSGASASGASGDEDDDSAASGKRLTPEDEERRRRRRERNKVAATKCRIKKRERTVNLVQESEILESQNYELKSQIQELETQRRRLVDMLSSHSPTCTRPGHVHQAVAPPQQQQQHYDLYSPTYPAAPGPGPATPGTYADVLMSQYCHGGQDAGAPGPAEDETLAPYFPGVTKHEIVDDPLLAALDDPLDVYGAYSQHPVLEHTVEHTVEHPYCRPDSLNLDTPASTPGSSAPSPAQHGLGVPLPGPGCPPCLPGALQSPTHLYQHQQHMLGAPLTPLSSDGVGVFGMDSGCMA